MAIDVKEEILRGTTAEWNLKDGITLKRLFQVRGIEGNPTDIVINALKAAKIPKVGSKHPTQSTLQCVTTSGTMIDVGQVTVTASYKAYEYGSGTEDTVLQVRLGGVVQSKQITQGYEKVEVVGRAGTYIEKLVDMVVEYDFNANGVPAAATTTKVAQSVDASKEVPLLSIAFSRIEDKQPLNKARIYLGQVNKNLWNGGAPGTWMCTRLEGTAISGGLQYTVDYEFIYDKDTWDLNPTFRHPDTGFIPPDVGAKKKKDIVDVDDGGSGKIQPNAKKFYRVYDAISFKPLGLEL